MSIVVSASSPFRISYCSPTLEALIGFNPDEVEGRTIKILSGPQTNLGQIQAAIKGTNFQQSKTLSALLYNKSAQTIEVTLTCEPQVGSNTEIESTECRLTFKQSNESIKANTNSEAPEKRPPSLSKIAFARDVFDRVCIAQNFPEFSVSKKFRFFKLNERVQYYPYCDDFGPLSIESIANFIELLDAELAAHPELKIVFCANNGRRALTNAVMLLGSYMILRLHMAAADVSKRFHWLEDSMIEGYRDASFAAPDFTLSLLDCWAGLERGRRLGWIATPTAPGEPWGQVDMAEYRLLDDALNGSVNVVVPGKFVALPTPMDLPPPSGRYRDEDGQRRFSPDYYGALLRELGATDVVRLNDDGDYDAAGLQAAPHCLRHHHLAFPDCSAPPPRVAEAFLALADAAGAGLVAVHCLAGLGRTGTLVALWLMRRRDFSAREAMGWLRLMRPGCVIGEQQHYLCAVERACRFAGPPPLSSGPPGVPQRTPLQTPPLRDACGEPLPMADPAVVVAAAAMQNNNDEERAAVAEQVRAGAAARRRMACVEVAAKAAAAVAVAKAAREAGLPSVSAV